MGAWQKGDKKMVKVKTHHSKFQQSPYMAKIHQNPQKGKDSLKHCYLGCLMMDEGR
jgi:hypothetical protein